MRLEEGEGTGERKSRVIFIVPTTSRVRERVVRRIPVSGQQLILSSLTQ